MHRGHGIDHPQIAQRLPGRHTGTGTSALTRLAFPAPAAVSWRAAAVRKLGVLFPPEGEERSGQPPPVRREPVNRGVAGRTRVINHPEAIATGFTLNER